MKSILFVSLALVSQSFAATEAVSTPIRPAAEIESSCRVKAKEIAAETYRTCVTDQKNAQIEQIKKEYAAKLQALKAHYEQELKKMNGGKSKADASDLDSANSEKKSNDSAATVAPAASTAAKAAPKKSIAKSAGKKAKTKKSTAVASQSTNEMTVQLKPAPITPPTDESTMDLPEPIPVEEVPAESAI